MKALGKHLIIELYGCSSAQINDLVRVERAMVEAVELSSATIIEPVFHQFSPHGVSGVVVIAESHFAIHTWPEYGYCALDIFTCGEQVDAEASLQFLRNEFQADSVSIVEIDRGVLDLSLLELRYKP